MTPSLAVGRGGASVTLAILTLVLAAAPGSAGSRRDRVQVNVSKARGVQSETGIAIDPSNDRILLAGSNSARGRRVYGYSSTDGGAGWRRVDPPFPQGAAGSADPIVAIDRHGRQYFGFVAESGPRRSPRLNVFIAARAAVSDVWGPPTVVQPAERLLDDKPALAVDASPLSPHADRVYLAWSRISRFESSIVLSYSDDGGVTWSAPTRVSDARSTFTSYASIATARDGTVYVAWWSVFGEGLYLDRSVDGGASFGRDRRVEPLRGTPNCLPPGIHIPAQPANCVRPNPIVSVDASAGPFAGRVYLTYADTAPRRQQDVFASAFDPELRPLLLRRRVNRLDGRVRADQFWPASAVDASTGYLWVCFYDTRGDRRRRRTFFTCTRSTNGGRSFARPVRAATAPSNETIRGADTRGSRAYEREYGDYEGLAAANRVAHPIWTDTRRLRALQEEIYTTTLSDASFRR